MIKIMISAILLGTFFIGCGAEAEDDKVATAILEELQVLHPSKLDTVVLHKKSQGEHNE